MSKCTNVFEDDRCPNPAVTGAKMCLTCLKISVPELDIEFSELDEVGEVGEVGKVTRRKIFAGDPRKLRAEQRTCTSLTDDGKKRCGKPAMKDSVFCDRHVDARREPELDVPLTKGCKARTEDGQCGEPERYRGYCEGHFVLSAIAKGATPSLCEPTDIEDVEAQLRELHEIMALMKSIAKYGDNDKNRVNAARAYERLTMAADRKHREYVKAKRAKTRVFPVIIGMDDDDDTNGSNGHAKADLMHIDEFRRQLPEGETI